MKCIYCNMNMLGFKRDYGKEVLLECKSCKKLQRTLKVMWEEKKGNYTLEHFNMGG